MDVEEINEIINAKPNLSTALGMEFLSTPEDDTCMARMQVDERNRQPFGFLSGGASLALAENVAGVGSSALCPGCACVGIEVSGSHVKAVAEGDTVTAYARLLHCPSAAPWHDAPCVECGYQGHDGRPDLECPGH